MKILEITNYSAGICGVWARVREESLRLSKNHEVQIFSSNHTKGSEQIAQESEKINGVSIKRFSSTRLGGESYMYWNFIEEAKKFNPDIIFVHGYRQTHNFLTTKLKKKIGCKIFLVTHAPFVKNNTTRSFSAKIAVRIFDYVMGPKLLKKFDKIIHITKWEVPELEKLGVDKKNLEYIPNGIPGKFFKIRKKAGSDNKLLFLGRVSPIKDLETLITSMKLIKNKDLYLEIVGPCEKKYFESLKKLIKLNGLGKKIRFTSQISDLNKKIRKLDSAKVFVLPSKREAMPQSLIEAMSRELIVISSNNPGSAELIEHGKSGFLFEVGNEEELSKLIDLSFKLDHSKIKKCAKKQASQFSWDKIMNKINNLLVIN